MSTSPIQSLPVAREYSTVLVHDDSYINWKFQDNSVTQGRRFTNARDLLVENIWDLTIVAPRKATRAELSLVHSDRHIDEVLLKHSCNEWDGAREDLAELAQFFAGGTLVALDALMSGRTNVAVHLAGAKHHAQHDHSSGFCVFADFAIAAKVAVSHGLKVAIFDFDAHHGDGTENLCADDPNILTYSIHERGIFPGTGNSSDPENHVYNTAINHDADYNFGDTVALINAASEFAGLARDFGADLIFIAAGADGHQDDPLSRLAYFPGAVSKAIHGITSSCRGLPMLIGGAGGYLPDTATPEMWLAAVESAAHPMNDFVFVPRNLYTQTGIDISGGVDGSSE